MYIFICILSAFCWATFDLTRKLSLKFINPKILLLLFSTVQLIVFTTWILTSNFSINLPNYYLPGTILIAVGIFSSILFLKAINDSQLSLTIPLLSFSPVFSSIFAFLFLGERLSHIQYIGVIFIFIGTLSLYAKELTVNSFLSSILIIINDSSARLMLGVSLMWSITPVLDKICLQYSTINIHGFLQSLGTSILLLLILGRTFKKGLTKLKKKEIKLISITIMVGTMATILQLYAIIFNYVPIMESIKRSVGQFSSVIIGNLFFNEPITLQKIFGVFLLTTGVTFVIFQI